MKEIITKSFLVIIAMFLFGGFITGCMSLEEKLASSDYETRKSGEIELFQNAARSGNESELRSAISRMTCSDVLASVVMSVDSVDLKMLAIGRIEDDRMLASLAVYAGNMEIQGDAVEKMKDQQLLLATYEAVTNADLKVKVIGRMAPTVIAVLPYDRCLAKRWDCVSNAAVLLKIIENDLQEIPEKDWQSLITKATEKADKKVRNEIESALAWQYANHYDSMSKEARDILVANLHEPMLLEKMITKVNDYEIKRAEHAWENNVSWKRRPREQAEKSVELLREEVKREEKILFSQNLEKYKEDLRAAEENLSRAKKAEQEVLDSKPRFFYVKSIYGRLAIHEKLGDDVLVKHANEAMKGLPKFHDYEKFDAWNDLNSMVANIKDASSRQNYRRKMLEIIGKEEEESDGKTVSLLFFGETTNYKWTEHDTEIAKRVVGTWKLGEHLDVVRKMLQENVIGWKYVIEYATSGMLVELLRDGAFKNAQLRMAAARRIDSGDLDVNLYKVVADDEVRKVLMSRMPEALRQEAMKINEAEIKDIFRVAEEKSRSTFSLHGFYLGMSLRDAKRLLEHSFPDANIKVYEHCIDVDVSDSHGMHFCEADEKGRIYRLSFNSKMIKKWYPFDVQDYGEWAKLYSEKMAFELARRPVQGENSSEDSFVVVDQEAYSRMDNLRGYKVTYFGKKDVTSRLGNEEMDFSVMRDEASAYKEGLRAGKIDGLKKWPRRGWENGDGAREGTLRAEILKED